MKALFSFLGWLILCVLLVGVSYRKYLAVRANEMVVAYTVDHRGKCERYSARFLADKLAWKRMEIFNPPHVAGPSHDIGDWLNARITWLPAGTARGSGSAPKSAMLKGYSFAIRDGAAFVGGTEKMAGWLDDWAAHAGDVFPPGKIPFADFSWMSTLQAYAYWDIDSAEPVKKAISLNTKLLTDELPEPSWGEIEIWGQLRLLHGIAMRSLAPALRDSRTLIRLLLSTERKNALDTAIRLLRRENQAVRVYRERVDPKFAGPPIALSSETLSALEGYLRAFPGMLDSATDPEMLAEAFQADGVIFGLCAELNALSARLFRDRVLLSDAYGFGIEAIERVVKDPGNGCRIPRLKLLWGNPDYLPPPFFSAGAAWQPEAIPGLPFFVEVSNIFDFRLRESEPPGVASLPSVLRGSSAVRRAVGINYKQNEESTDPWASYARQK